MTRYLILLELTRTDVSYAPEPLQEELNKLFGDEWQCDQKAFMTEVHDMLCDGLIDMSDGLLKLARKGETLLRHSRLIAFVQGRMAVLLKP
ncbi:MAG: hypothetical protein HY460_01855 [Parcubacteria group bacterium]|nr:hypothetical protein [Parcubacteria group bacterium]